MASRTLRLHSSSRSRQRPSRPQSPTAVLLPNPEGLIFPEGGVQESTAELLQELAHTRPEGASTLLAAGAASGAASDDDADEAIDHARLPWYRRPSYWWLLAMVPFTAIAMSATIAPRIEIYSILVCQVHKPEISTGTQLPYIGTSSDFAMSSGPLHGLPSTDYHDVNTNTSETNPMAVYDSPDTRAGQSECMKDPLVQAQVAKLSAVIATSTGILSAATTGLWSPYSDRHGRTIVMGLSILGLLITDFNFIFVAFFFRNLPGKYWFLVVGPIIEGVFGGMTTGVAAIHAYVADTTDSSSRSRVFALSTGLLFTGMGIGPTLGGLLVKYSNNILSVFYFATAIHVVYGLMIWLVIPESLSTVKRMKAQQMYKDNLNLRDPAKAWARRLFGFLQPLAVILPTVVRDRQGRKRGRNWNLTCVALAYACVICIFGSYSYNIQYTSLMFGWTSVDVGYYLSVIGVSRAVVLTFILPVILRLFKPAPPVVRLHATSSEPLITSENNTSSPPPPSVTSTRSIKHTISPSSSFLQKALTFDLNLARFSLVVDIIAASAAGLVTSGTAFVAATTLTSLGTGFGPTIQSVAVELHASSYPGAQAETGKVFGALGVIQAICMGVLGPAIFGTVYSNTVTTTPSAIFAVSAMLLTTSFVVLLFVRFPSSAAADDVEDADAAQPLMQSEEEEQAAIES